MRNHTKKIDTRLTVSITRDQFERLGKFAVSPNCDRSISYVVRRAIDEYLTKRVPTPVKWPS